MLKNFTKMLTFRLKKIIQLFALLFVTHFMKLVSSYTP